MEENQETNNAVSDTGNRKQVSEAAEQLRQAAEATQKLVRKSKRGGPRPGAGRKPNYLKKSGVPPVLAHQILAMHDVFKLWASLLTSRNEHVKLQSLIYLTNREQGMPKFQGEMRNINEHVGFQEIRIRLVDGNNPNPGPAQVFLPSASETGVVAPQEILSPSSAPDPTPLPTGECQVHGRYVLPRHDSPQICPTCQKEAEWYERKLRNLLPGGAA